MKRALIAALERIRMDLLDAIVALEHDNVDAALAKLASVSERLAETVREVEQS